MKNFYLLCLAFFSSSFAEDIQPVFLSEVEPMALIENVHVVTGQFTTSFTDYVLPGPDNLVISRQYATRMGSLDGFQYFDDLQGKVSKHEAFFPSQTGSYYVLDEMGSKHYRLVSEKNRRGLNNFASGYPSGKTHPKNMRVKLSNSNLGSEKIEHLLSIAEQFCPDGTRRKFIAIGVNGSEDFRINRLNNEHVESETYLLDEERLPSGNWIEYKYKKQVDNMASMNSMIQDGPLKWHYAFAGAVLKNSNKEETLCSYTIESGFSYTNWLREPIEIHTSDGKTLQFHIQKVGDHSVLSSVEMEGKRPEFYSYEFRKNRYGGFYELTGIKRPEGRKIEIEYYRPGKNELLGRTIKVDKDSNLESRVKRIKLPLGQSGAMLTTRSYFYHFDNNKKSKISGSTETYDSYNNRIDSYYNTDGLIEKVVHFDKDKVDTSEKYFWGEGQYQGHLITKALFDENEKCKKAEHFEYDSNGNVLKHTVVGNLTGTDEQITLSGNTPKLTEQNSYSCEYKYSDDGFNLLVWEKQGEKETLYEYKPDTNLLTAVYLQADGKIQKRTFHSYDDRANLIETIEDDGSEKNPEDFSGVSARLITRIKPRQTMPALGMPEQIASYYYDLSMHAYHLLRKEKFAYDNNHNQVKKQVFDANNQLAFETYSTYDEYSNLISHTNPLGEQTTYEYDQNNNLIKISLPKKGAVIEYSYDFVNRKTVEKQTDATDTKTTRYIYDNNHNLITTIDPNENEISHTYNHRNLPITTSYPKMKDLYGNVIKPKESVKYDALGHILEKTDPNGNTSYHAQTIRNQPYSFKDAEGSIETISYYPNGNVKEKKSKTGLVIHYTYDYQDRVTKIETYDPATQKTYTETSVFNAFHIVSQTDPNGITTSYKYDHANRLIEIQKELFRIRYHYDSLSRVCKEDHYSEEGLQFAKSIFYDLLDRVVEVQMQDAAGNVQKKEGFAYDELGNQSQHISYGANGQEVTTTTYDLWKRVLTIEDAQGNVTSFQYKTLHNDLGQTVNQTIETDPAGVITITTFDAYNRITLLEKKSQKLLLQKRYIYDACGNLVFQEEKALESNQSFTEELKYDKLHRPIEQILAKNTPHEKHIKMRYGSQGFLSEKIKPDQISLYFSYDGYGNRLTTKSSDHTIDYEFAYDLNGNLVRTWEHGKVLCQRAYDHNNLLIEETYNDLAYKKKRDAMGRIIQCTLPDGSQVFYHYHGIFLDRLRKSGGGSESYVWENPIYDQSGRLIAKPILSTFSKIKYSYNKNGLQTSLNAPTYSESVQYNETNNPVEQITTDAQLTFKNKYSFDALNQLTKESGKYNHSYEHDALHNPMQMDEDSYAINSVNQIESISDHTTCKYDLNGNLIYKKTNLEEVFYYYDALDRLTKVKSIDNYIIHFQYDHSYRRLEQYVQVWDYTTLDQAKALLDPTIPKTLQTKEHLYFLYDETQEIGSFENHKMTSFKLLHPTTPTLILAIEAHGYAYTPIQDYRTNICAIISNGKTHNYRTYRFSAFGERTSVDYNAMLQDPIIPYGYMGKRHITETTLIAFGFRDYDLTLRRWITPDPAGFIDGLNLYAFVRNNPLRYTDAFGLFIFSSTSNNQFSLNNFFKAGTDPIGPFNGSSTNKTSNTSYERVGNDFSPKFDFASLNDTRPRLQYLYNPGIRTDAKTCYQM